MRRLLFGFLLLLSSTIIFSTCSDSGTGPDPGNEGGGGNEQETTTYNINIDVTPSDAGTISPSAEDSYDEGEEIELQADPNDEYVFTHWSGDIDSTADNPFSLTVDQDYNLTANFEIKSYELTTSTEGEGAISEEILEQKSKEYEYGTVVELTANPAEGYRFVEWQGDVTGSENPAQITVDNPKEVTAVFEKKTYALTVNTDGEGAVAEEIVQQKATDYEYGTVVELTANPAEGWEFKEWSGANTSSDNPIEITVDSPKEVTAIFEEKSHSLTINTEGEGSVAKDPDQSEYDHNTNVQLTANPAEGWKFVEWQGDIEGTDNPAQITLDQSKEATAVFEKKSYELTVNTEGEGAVSEEVVQQKTTDYDHGTVVKLTANPAEGYKFIEWTGDITGTDNPAQITVDEPKEVTAVFEKKSFTVTTTTSGEGSITKDPEQEEYEHNSTVELSATPSEGYEFTQWQGDATGTTNPLSLTVDTNKEIEAVFNLKTYSLTANTSGEGTVTKDPDQSEYDHGSTVDLTAEPAEGYKFVEWTGDVTSTESSVQLTMDNDKEVTAVFEKKSYTLTTNINGEGSVAKNPDQTEYEYNSSVELTANPSEGWKFVEWQGDVSSTDNPTELTIDSNKEVTAVFEKKSFTLSVETSGEGSVTLNPDQTEYEYGTEVELTANASGDWAFDKWEGDVTGKTNPIVITMDADKSVTALFENTLFAGGAGTEDNPYQISTVDQLQNINQYLSSHYVQINNVDASETDSWNGGKGFKPIGDDIIKFSGTYNGQNYDINDLFINRENQDYVGLFGFIEGGGIIKNLSLFNLDITGDNSVGAIGGYNYGGKVENVHTNGELSGLSKIGGVVGRNISGEIQSSSVNINISGQVVIGGIAGESMTGYISDINASGEIIASSNYIGGIVGQNFGEIKNSISSIDITSTAGDFVGGLVGDHFSSSAIVNSKTEGDISANNYVGGLIGQMRNGEVHNSSSDGNISGNNYIGGLIGYNEGRIQKSIAEGNIDGNKNIGGLIGSNNNNISTSISLGDVAGSYNIGGFIGVNQGLVENSYSHGKVTGEESSGGLIGVNKNNGTLKKSYRSGMVSGDTDTGGLVGTNGATVQSSYWDTESTNQTDAVGRGSSDGTTGLTTSEMTSTSAENNMTEFDWVDIWVTTDSYPALFWE